MSTPHSNLTNALETKTERLASETKGHAGASPSNLLSAALSEKKDAAVAWAKENPLMAAAIGVGVGFVLGSFARRMINRRA